MHMLLKDIEGDLTLSSFLSGVAPGRLKLQSEIHKENFRFYVICPIGILHGWMQGCPAKDRILENK